MSNSSWQKWQVRAWLEVDGQELPITSGVVSFDLNGIPVAQVGIQMGRNADTGDPMPIHLLQQLFAVETPVKLWGQFDLDGKAGEIPDLGLGGGGRFLLLDGVTVNRNRSLSAMDGTAVYMLALQHKLVRLNDSSCFSQSAHPLNPGHYSYGSLMQNTGTGAPHWVGTSLASEFAQPGVLKEDLWGAALFKFMKSLTQADAIYIAEVGLKGSGKNDGAAEAIELISPDRPGYQPLAVRLDFDNDLASKISTDICRSAHDPSQLASFTLWDLLVGRYAQEYLFSVVPRTSDAIVVPFVAALRQTSAVIKTEHNLSDVQLSNRPLRAIGILSEVSSRTGMMDASADGIPSSSNLGIGGWYEGRKDGQIRIQQGPSWTSTLLAASRYAASTSGAKNEVVGRADQPGAGEAGDPPRDRVEQNAKVRKSFLDQYAKTVYALESLKGRQAEVSDVLRLDIAPGSSVAVESVSDIHSGEEVERMYATVLRVTLSFSCGGRGGGGTAGTSFHLGYIRSEEENSDDATSVEAHPLYNNAFAGCPLLTPQ